MQSQFCLWYNSGKEKGPIPPITHSQQKDRLGQGWDISARADRVRELLAGEFHTANLPLEAHTRRPDAGFPYERNPKQKDSGYETDGHMEDTDMPPAAAASAATRPFGEDERRCPNETETGSKPDGSSRSQQSTEAHDAGSQYAVYGSGRKFDEADYLEHMLSMYSPEVDVDEADGMLVQE